MVLDENEKYKVSTKQHHQRGKQSSCSREGVVASSPINVSISTQWIASTSFGGSSKKKSNGVVGSDDDGNDIKTICEIKNKSPMCLLREIFS